MRTACYNILKNILRYGKLIHVDVHKILKQLPIDTIYHKWDLNNNYKVFYKCDCGIIPLN